MLDQLLSGSGRTLIAGAPEGIDALTLARLARLRRGEPGQPVAILHVARDDARLARLAGLLAFFDPALEVLSFPAWDCLPYDRVSPHRDVVARRIDTLCRLVDATVESAVAPRILLTTVGAMMQRVPPAELFAERRLRARAGERLDPEALIQWCAANGYLRSETVGEPGEYAVRGGLVDVFPPGAEEPLRLDFFGDELDAVRRFDPLSQRSTGSLEALALEPVGEVLLETAAIERFRLGYREAFGSLRDDPLYEAVSEGRLYPGLEHWLPLFYERLAVLPELCPGAAITLDHQAEAVRDTRLESIDDFYRARRELLGAEAAGGSPYKPLPPERLYLDAAGWEAALAGRAVGQLAPFAAPDHQADALDAGGRLGIDFAEARASADGRLYDAVARAVDKAQSAGRTVLIAAESAGALDRLGHLLAEHGFGSQRPVASLAEAEALAPGELGLATLELDRGFANDALAVISEQDILGERLARASRRRKRAENFLTEVSALHEGDLVVHVDHGVGRYEGLVALDVGGAPHDCLKVIYQGGDRLFVPVESIEVLSRYGGDSATAELDRLGQGSWQARKARVKARLKMIADELIKIAAARELKGGEAMLPPEGLYDEFCARFPYPETEDQERAIAETLDDLKSGRPMDRLVCGDVGFGKTEVALRAAFVAAMSGRQVAVVVPTTLLCRQHALSFQARFAGLPIRVGALSRLTSAKDAKAIKQGLADGTLDIVIGTHALLAKSIAFRDLGLLIVDEEQHFGVKQKERLKRLREEVHVLTLTATPIPRTLQLSLSGVKEMSMIATPPVDRLAVRSFVLPYDPVIVREAILRERNRGGQCFYVCPRIEDLEGVAERLRSLVPEIRFGLAHGQLSGGALEAVMTEFLDHRIDLLLSTNIIESGLDIPSANTLIVHRADMFGLAQLYQIRGRIGRSKIRGYAYLTVPPGRMLGAAAQRRLEVMQTLDSLGAGFTLASHDMDIRGAGNLLGEEQSGHIREVGIELYQQLLEEAVAAARGGGRAAEAAEAVGAGAFTPQINVGMPVLIPEPYVRDLNVRLGLYRRLATLVDPGEIEAFAAELIDRFGPLPEEVENLLSIIAIKRLCRAAGVDKVDAGPKGAVVSFYKDRLANVEGLMGFIQAQPGRVNLRPDQKLVYRRQWEDTRARVRGLKQMLGELGKAVA